MIKVLVILLSFVIFMINIFIFFLVVFYFSLSDFRTLIFIYHYSIY